MKRKPARKESGGQLKIAISLPASLYKAVERARAKRGQNRSEFFRGAVGLVTGAQPKAPALHRESRRGGQRRGVQELLRFAGALEAADAEEMRQAVEEGCERTDAGEW